MIVYSQSKAQFVTDASSDAIANIVEEKVLQRLGTKVAKNELLSWKNSLTHMGNVLNHASIPDDAGVAIEYNIPLTSKRIDLVLTGENQNQQSTAVIIELKQWSEVESTPLDGIVKTYLGGGLRTTNHPSYQAWSYAAHIEDYNATVRQMNAKLVPCAHLHNLTNRDAINDPCYSDHVLKAPVFIKSDFAKLQKFLAEHIRYGDKTDLMYRIEHGKIKPSKNLADSLASMISGNQEFILLDDQKVCYEEVLQALTTATQKPHKQVVVIKGGPGTGKSVLAINLLVEATKRQAVAQYISRNSAPREVFKSKLTGTLKKTNIDNLFKGSGSYVNSDENFFDLLLVDEAHRLNEKSGMFQNLGENQIKEIISAAKCSVFFIDEAQRIHIKDIGSVDAIKQWASLLNAEVIELDLKSQFRCNGSDAYLAWLDNTLNIRETANIKLDTEEFDLQVLDSPDELEHIIKAKNLINNKARIVAGYCWNWTSKKDPKAYDIAFEGFEFKARWNLADYGMHWIIHEESVSEVGCIHTCQGLELDYVGVIIGPDLIIRDGEVITNGLARSSQDQTLKGFKKLLKENPTLAHQRADEIIKNTYRTLLTRGQKGAYVYSEDAETRAYFKTALAQKFKRSELPPVIKKEIVDTVRGDASKVAECAAKYGVEVDEIRGWVAKAEAAMLASLE
ncbi:DUF2075 domain-containing protein [Umboniibacter marinipuniceus]|uniref:Schlafen group 3-like DNA/RNA helicase domain-containing protein n=1 Tax=Umboniibacter marinipuniceus TaxID=569599 RepID=A0A3M0ACH4_9GAMM|nr:DUF2075 domain-containing protein [Umboniibacter marinipuniceus]RMA82630.1 hypothetical protein DFR27_0581 [Umboniibacter marinipuniceus]